MPALKRGWAAPLGRIRQQEIRAKTLRRPNLHAQGLGQFGSMSGQNKPESNLLWNVALVLEAPFAAAPFQCCALGGAPARRHGKQKIFPDYFDRSTGLASRARTGTWDRLATEDELNIEKEGPHRVQLH